MNSDVELTAKLEEAEQRDLDLDERITAFLSGWSHDAFIEYQREVQEAEELDRRILDAQYQEAVRISRRNRGESS